MSFVFAATGKGAPRAAPAPRTVLLLLTAVAVLWDIGGLDLALARLAGGPAGFAWRDHWLLTDVMHSSGRWLAYLMALLLCLGVWWPAGPLRRLPQGRRLQLALSVWVGVVAVSMAKWFSPTSCPWDLQAFGGVAQHLPHWAPWLGTGGGGGHCFPAGHASAGFAFVGGWFACRHDDPAQARRWLLGALVAGLLLGLGQQWRGAHFMSHTLWSAWLCWAIAWALDAAWSRHLRRRAARAGTGQATR